jgi:TolB-like protein/DNA-binding winged helix-turn-helix (wHTH) protein/Tfp pilus assembly protein PilF
MATETALVSAPDPGSALALRFGPFTMDLRTLELRRGEALVHLQQQPFKVLVVLAAHPGALVTREEIRKEVWGPDRFVEFDQSLNFCVKQIRSALGDQADTPQFIETLPRRGYRFIAPVEFLGGDGAKRGSRIAFSPAATVPATASEPFARARARRRFWAVAGATVFVAVAALLVSRRPSTSEAKPGNGRVMLAVLPFENMSSDPEQEYFSDGLTEEMITGLARLGPGRLGVIARTSSSAYKGKHTPVDQIGRELGVDYVLEGSVRRSGDRVKVTAQLIQVKDQTHLWAEAYERRADDLLRLQDELAARIVGSLEARLSSAAPTAALAGTSPAAYEAYLKGRYHLSRRSAIGINEEGLTRSVDYFQEAIAKDPAFAAAHAGLASAYVALSEQGRVTPQEAFPKVRAAAERAIALDGGTAEAHTALAVTRMYFDWDWPGAGASFARALELDPGRAPTHHAYAGFLSAQGRHAEALAAIDRARVLDPLSAAVNGDLGWYLYFARRYDEAIAQYKKAFELEPQLGWLHAFLLDAYAAKGAFAEAKAEGVAVMRANKAEADLRRMEVAFGRDAVLLYVGFAIDSMERRTPPPAEFLAARLAQTGRRDEALTWLEKAADLRSRWLVSLVLVEPRFDGIRADPRFQAVLRRVGLGRSIPE